MNTSFIDSSPRLRIADILLNRDEDEDEEQGNDGEMLPIEGCAGAVSWLRSRFRAAKFNNVSGQVAQREQDATSNVKCSTGVLNGGDSPCTVPRNHQSGCPTTEPSFNMGVAGCLLYLIAASKNELDKMVELRTQMEMLLQDAKKELETKDTLADPFKFNDVRKDVRSSYHHSLQNTKTSVVTCDQSLTCETSNSEQRAKGMDWLEAELEAEFEQFLVQYPQQQRIEVIKNTDSKKSQSSSSGEVIDPQEEEYTEVEYGVPPYELERRLHEVLEARQREQIRELEAALESARHKLHEKDVEISRWKDTAKLLSQHGLATSWPTS